MKRLILAASALSLLLTPAAFADPMQHRPMHKMHTQSGHVVVVRPAHHGWVRGHALPRNYRGNVVRDYGHYHLRRPGTGQHWVRVDNQYILVGITSGIIGAIIAAQ